MLELYKKVQEHIDIVLTDIEQLKDPVAISNNLGVTAQTKSAFKNSVIFAIFLLILF